jgi:hypothetical protein
MMHSPRNAHATHSISARRNSRPKPMQVTSMKRTGKTSESVVEPTTRFIKKDFKQSSVSNPMVSTKMEAKQLPHELLQFSEPSSMEMLYPTYTLEPTPIATAPGQIQIVDQLQLSWNSLIQSQDDAAALMGDCLRPLLTSMTAQDCRPSFTSSMNQQENRRSQREEMIPNRVVSDHDHSHTSDTDESSSTRLRESHLEKWSQRYQDLLNFMRENGHCLVPLEYAPNPTLAHWVKRQRCQYKFKQEGNHSTLTDERQLLLEKHGFVWDSHKASWEERVHEISHFRDLFGHTNVPSNYPANQQLAVWVKCQRRQFKLYSEGKRSNMTTERIAKLSCYGFVWTPRKRKRDVNNFFQPHLLRAFLEP